MHHSLPFGQPPRAVHTMTAGRHLHPGFITFPTRLDSLSPHALASTLRSTERNSVFNMNINPLAHELSEGDEKKQVIGGMGREAER